MNRKGASLAALMLLACKPRLVNNGWLVTSTRLLAAKSEPAEAKPGTMLAYTALIADISAENDAGTIAWNFCTAPKPPTENNVVSAACLDAASLLPAGDGLSIVAATPFNACSTFGPNTAPGGFRPRDADATGGYYQPLRIDVPSSDPAFHLERILCDLANAPYDIAAAFGEEYVPNNNPHLLPIVATIGTQTVSFDGIPSGAHVEFEAIWSAADAETYAYFDSASQTISTQREAMSVAWYVSAGTLGTEFSGRAEGDLNLYAINTWTAPSAAGSVKLWVVLRDSRAGVDWASYELTVLP